MSAVRSLAACLLGALAVVACSSSSASNAAPDAGYCVSNGYAAATSGTCAKGTCLQAGMSAACCGSVCATCEDKGLVSYTSAGTCPAGLCPSADVTATLACCDSAPSVMPDGTYCEPAAMDSGAAEASPEAAPVDSGVTEASGD
jgi:hypothetical protein